MVKCSKLSTFDWVRLRDFELIARGHDPADRIRVTGHSRCLAEPYLVTIGKWGGTEVRELINEMGVESDTLLAGTAALQRFKSRKRLLGRAQFARVYGAHPWTRAEVSYRAYDRAQQAFGSRGAQGPLGVAINYAWASAVSSPKRRSVGLLPVEGVCWVRAFDAMLAEHEFSFASWLALTDDEKLWVWGLGGVEGRPWSVESFLYAPGVRTLPDRDMAEAS